MRYLLILAYCILCVFIIDRVTSNLYLFSFGKDNGVIAKILFTCLSSELLFLFICKSVLRYFIGLLLGILSFILVYACYYIFFVVMMAKPNGLAVPLLLHLSFAFLFIYIFSILTLKFPKNNPSERGGKTKSFL